MGSGWKSGLMHVSVPVAVAIAAICAMPSPGLAVSEPARTLVSEHVMRFTPANVDPELAERIANRYAGSRETMRFTPAGVSENRTVNVAVRVDDQSARAISFRTAELDTPAGRRRVAVTDSQFDLGLSRGYQSFSKPATQLPRGIAHIEMPDLAEFRPSPGVADKPGRLQPRIALESGTKPGRAPRTLEGLGDQSLDLGGAYRVTGNLDVTAGVRLSQDRDRLNPLTDGVADDKAVYVGTELRF